MDEKNINISKSEEEFLEIMENRSHITADQLHNLKEDEECLQALLIFFQIMQLISSYMRTILHNFQEFFFRLAYIYILFIHK